MARARRTGDGRQRRILSHIPESWLSRTAFRPHHRAERYGMGHLTFASIAFIRLAAKGGSLAARAAAMSAGVGLPT